MSKKTATTVAIASTYAGVSLSDALTAATRMNKSWCAKRAAGKSESEQKATFCAFLYGMLQAFPNKAERLASVDAFAQKLDEQDGVPTDWRSGSSLASRLADCRTISTYGTAATLNQPTYQKALAHAKAIKSGKDDAEATAAVNKACEKDPVGMLELALPQFLAAFVTLRKTVPAAMLTEFDIGVMEQLG